MIFDLIKHAKQLLFDDSKAKIGANNVQGAIEGVFNKSCKSMGVQQQYIGAGSLSWDFSLNLDGNGTYLVSVRGDNVEWRFIGVLFKTKIGGASPSGHFLYDIASHPNLGVKLITVEGVPYLNVANNNADWAMPIYVDIAKIGN